MELLIYLIGYLVAAVTTYQLATNNDPSDIGIPINILMSMLVGIISWAFAIPALVIIALTKAIKYKRTYNEKILYNTMRP